MTDPTHDPRSPQPDDGFELLLRQRLHQLADHAPTTVRSLDEIRVEHHAAPACTPRGPSPPHRRHRRHHRRARRGHRLHHGRAQRRRHRRCRLARGRRARLRGRHGRRGHPGHDRRARPGRGAGRPPGHRTWTCRRGRGRPRQRGLQPRRPRRSRRGVRRSRPGHPSRWTTVSPWSPSPAARPRGRSTPLPSRSAPTSGRPWRASWPSPPTPPRSRSSTTPSSSPPSSVTAAGT